MASPLIWLYLARRKAIGKEDEGRIGERLGRPGLARPEGALVWCHGASVGEAVSVLPLIERLLDRCPEAHLLVTTGTVTSARIMAERLPPRALHQYVPVDAPGAVKRFLDHWRPDLALWVESELWPNLVLESRARGVPMVLVNGRMSERSLARWKRFSGLVRPLLDAFALILAQSPADAGRFEALGADHVRAAGNLKFDAPALAADAAALAEARAMVKDRPIWLAASTHPGEEVSAAKVHARIEAELPRLLTVVVPRHPERGRAVKEALEAEGLSVALRSRKDRVTLATDIYVADSLGELGLFYRLSPVVFVGGSLVPHGGQNPLEPARLGCAVIFGPHMENFAPAVEAMLDAKAALAVADEAGLAEALRSLIGNEEKRRGLADAAADVARELSGALDEVLAELDPYLAATQRPSHARA
ncbi:MAG: 3-deoxy-D-manno-octulosonic acid transferase [Alphaproteobacteria bacterium]